MSAQLGYFYVFSRLLLLLAKHKVGARNPCADHSLGENIVFYFLNKHIGHLVSLCE